jgi:tetratricopeptide (TPR) repeat protein
LIRWSLTPLFLATSAVFGAAAGQERPEAGARPAERQQLDASPALFTVMAAINAAGYDADLESPSNSPLRREVRRAIAARAPASLTLLKRFFAAHHQTDATAEVSQYISFAMCVDGPPDFRWRYKTSDLAPDVAALEGFQDLLATFYREADVEAMWRQAQPAFEAAIARYHRPVTEALTQVNAYLRASTSGPLGTSFHVYVDLLAAPNQVQMRSYGNDYFVVVTPSPDLQIESIRHAYLHFMLDALSMRYATELDNKKTLLDYALASPLLESDYRTDFGLFANECLIKAVEARLAQAPTRQGLIDQALRSGYVMTPAFAEGLIAYEKQEQSLRFYYPTLVDSIKLKREAQRLDKIEFLSERPGPKARLTERPVEPTGPYKTLEEAERLYFAEPPDLKNAKAAYERLLKEAAEKPLQAKAYYGLARIALHQNDPDAAERLLGQTLECDPDPQVKAWTEVYLGRLADAAGETERAIQRYQAALAVQGASEKARKAAQQGIEKASGRH